jgi:hypothetical protein
MRNLHWLWLSLALCSSTWSALGCGDDLDGETLIGLACSEDTDCDVGGVCVTSGRDGLCTQECNAPGRAQACPLGSFCDRQQVETADDRSGEMTLCFPGCDSQADCREGYSCNGVSEGYGKVCRPKAEDD